MLYGILSHELTNLIYSIYYSIYENKNKKNIRKYMSLADVQYAMYSTLLNNRICTTITQNGK